MSTSTQDNPTAASEQGPSTGALALQPVIVDLDGGPLAQRELIQRFDAPILDWRQHGPELRYWCGYEPLQKLADQFASQFGGIEGHIAIYGSGDFHNVTWAWLSMLSEPVTLIHFDNHTDLGYIPPKDGVNAGNWAVRAKHMDVVKRHVMIGVDGDAKLMLDPPMPVGTPSTDYTGFVDNTLELYPTSNRKSMFFGRLRADNPSVTLRPLGPMTRASWRTVREFGPEAIIDDVLDRLPTEAVYVTIDKDVLREADAFTNYYRRMQGDLTADDLVVMLGRIAQRKRVVAADINGDGSWPELDSRLKRVFRSWKDAQMTREQFSDPAMTLRNDRVNQRIVQALNGQPDR